MRIMTSTQFSVAALVASLATLVTGGGVARADIAPPDSCSSPGQPCQNAGTGYNQAGSCVATTCTKQVRSSDGGLTPMTYSCDVCQASGAAGSGGTGTGGSGPGGSSGTGTGGSGPGGSSGTGTGGSGPGGSSGTGTGGAPSHSSSGSSGCTVAGNAGGGDAASMIALGLLGLALGSRRRTSV
jgi:uncharacterized protein (TIGR03382 family)